MTKFDALKGTVRGALFSTLAIVALAACGEQPTEVELPEAVQMTDADDDDGNCILINGIIRCNE